MNNVYKKTTIPFNMSQMEDLGDIDTNIYIVSYCDSQLQGEEFINYIVNSSKLCDIVDYENIDSNTKINMMRILFTQPELVFLPCMAQSFILALFTYKNIETLPESFKNSFLTQEEIKIYVDRYKDDFKNYIRFFDSLFVYMLTVSSLMVNNPQKEITYNDLISKYKDITIIDDKNIIPVNICSILFSPFFYKYYEKPINEKEIYFYKQQYTEKMYTNKTILSLILNEANTIIISLLKTMETLKDKN